MPDYIQQLAPQIYHSRWGETVQLEQVADDMDTISAMVDASDEARYAIIIDMTATRNYPMNVNGLVRVARADPRIKAFIFINGDKTAKFLGNLLKSLSKHDLKFVESEEEALNYAHTILEQTAS